MNEQEKTYQSTLEKMFENKCYNCGCTPKYDEWIDSSQFSGEDKNLCIDCQNDE
jgi:hypothetical protein